MSDKKYTLYVSLKPLVFLFSHLFSILRNTIYIVLAILCNVMSQTDILPSGVTCNNITATVAYATAPFFLRILSRGNSVARGYLFVRGSAEFARIFVCIEFPGALLERLIVPIWRNQITLLLVSRPLSYQLFRSRG